MGERKTISEDARGRRKQKGFHMLCEVNGNLMILAHLASIRSVAKNAHSTLV